MAKKEMVYLRLWFSYKESFDLLDDAELGRLIRGCIEYASRSVEPKFEGNERFIWTSLIRNQIDKDIQTYKNRGDAGTQNVKARYTKEKQKPDEVLPTATNGYQDLPTATNEEDESHQTTKKVRDKGKKGKKEYKRYGTYQHVIIPDSEISKLREEFPTTLDAWIEDVDMYCEKSGKEYKNAAVVIREWARRNPSQHPEYGSGVSCAADEKGDTPSWF